MFGKIAARLLKYKLVMIYRQDFETIRYFMTKNKHSDPAKAYHEFLEKVDEMNIDAINAITENMALKAQLPSKTTEQNSGYIQ